MSLFASYRELMPVSRLPKIAEEKTYYHIYNKGMDSRIIFKDDEDFSVFLGFLKEYLTIPGNPEDTKKNFNIRGRTYRGTPHLPKNYFGRVELTAYSLMPDHFHLLLYQVNKNSIQDFIRSLCTRYSIYFNKKYHRSGALFQGPYKSAVVSENSQLLYLTRYLHKHSSVYSSYPHYLGRKEASWIKSQAILSSTVISGDYQSFADSGDTDEQEKILKGLTIESEAPLLESRDLTSQNQEPRVRTLEIIGVTAAFFVLLSFGFQNINAYSVESTTLPPPTIAATSTPTVSGSSTEIVESEIQELQEEIKSGPKLVIVISDESKTANIRQAASVESKRIGEAKNGDVFEKYVAINEEWYEITLEDGSTGFVHASCAYIQLSNN